ncbi:hypothetical protein A1D23_07715 [Chelonobacter oris]|nr:hypothetical protein [Chelonobacter oris]
MPHVNNLADDVDIGIFRKLNINWRIDLFVVTNQALDILSKELISCVYPIYRSDLLSEFILLYTISRTSQKLGFSMSFYKPIENKYNQLKLLFFSCLVLFFFLSYLCRHRGIFLCIRLAMCIKYVDLYSRQTPQLR